MSDSRVIKEYQYQSILSEPLSDFVAQKRGSGFLYNSEAKMLFRFDKFVITSKQTVCAIPQDLFQAYTAKTVYDSERNHRARYWLIRQFAMFMRTQGFEAYVPQNECNQKNKSNFVPYIFTETELSKFFATAETYKLPSHANNNSKLEMIIPVIFKMLYGGGFRVSELTHLRLSDIDFENGIVKIVHSKFGNTRLVPLDDSLLALLKGYSEKVHTENCPDAIFFQKSDGNIYSEKAIYQNFRTILWRAGISHGGKGKGPRLHDIRHTFAVHKLKYWAKQNCDVSAMLPYLSAYMGHKNLNATQDYLRLTVDAFPTIIQTLETAYGCIIPECGGVHCDS